MKIYKRRNPEWSFEVLKQHKDALFKGQKTRGYMFVTQWQKHIDEGMSEEDAYQKVNSEFQAIEEKVSEEQDALLTKQVRTLTAPSMLEFLAEEDKYYAEAMSYHKSVWFAAKNKPAANAELVVQKNVEPGQAEGKADESASADKGAGKKAPKPSKKK
jgi:hypothetical protein